jgi:hypothetical protein
MPEALAGLRFHCRRGTLADAPAIAALAIQVFLDTYAPDGVAPEIAREVLDGYGEDAFSARLRDRRVGTTEHVIGTSAYLNHVFVKSLHDLS